MQPRGAQLHSWLQLLCQSSAAVVLRQPTAAMKKRKLAEAVE